MPLLLSIWETVVSQWEVFLPEELGIYVVGRQKRRSYYCADVRHSNEKQRSVLKPTYPITSRGNPMFKKQTCFFVIAVSMLGCFAAGHVVGGAYYMEICTGIGPTCPTGPQVDDNGACWTCQVAGTSRACASFYVPFGCGGGHVCGGACGGAGGTPCTFTMTTPC